MKGRLALKSTSRSVSTSFNHVILSKARDLLATLEKTSFDVVFRVARD
jgi:hypothetical protein